jgi:2-polyprenyl-3-methyl-5-hydroxy-6-metoxy-1,4-benzoquinol methylase
MILPPENPYGHTKKLRYFLEQLKPLEGTYATVLDFGCGNGTAVTAYLSNLFLRVVGVESDPACWAYASRTLPNCQFYHSLDPLLSQSFDAIICSDVLEHLPAPCYTLLHLRALLKPGGFLLGSIPNGRGMFERENRFYKMPFGRSLSMAVELALNPWRLFKPNRPGLPSSASPHVQFFSFVEFVDLVNSAGFFVEQLKPGVTLGSPPFTAHILEKSQTLMDLNGRIADRMPIQKVSTWLFRLDRNPFFEVQK